MSDYSSFTYGSTLFPLVGPSASLLKDADPALFYLLEFYRSILETHLGSRLLAESALAGVTSISSAVAEVLPLDPAPFLVQNHLKFPLLAAYRTKSKFEWEGTYKFSVDDVEVVYVLPPLEPGQAERLMPILRAAARIIDSRTEQGRDPAYTPSGGAAGDSFWQPAGLASAGVREVSYGAFEPADRLFFPAVRLVVEMRERSEFPLSAFEDFEGGAVDIDVHDTATDTTLERVVQIEVVGPPEVLSLSPSEGEAGAEVTITGTGFVPGTLPVVMFGTSVATAVDVVDASTLTCTVPEHSVFDDELAVDVTVINIDGQSGTLAGAFTYEG